MLDKKLFDKVGASLGGSKSFYSSQASPSTQTPLDLYKLTNSLRSDKLVTKNLLLSFKKLSSNLRVSSNQNSYVEFNQNYSISNPFKDFSQVRTSYSVVDKLNPFDKEYFFKNSNPLKSKSLGHEKSLNSSPFLKKFSNGSFLSKSNKSTSATSLQPVASNNIYKREDFSYFNNNKFSNAPSNFLNESKNVEASKF